MRPEVGVLNEGIRFRRKGLVRGLTEMREKIQMKGTKNEWKRIELEAKRN
ncbi:hypothetical protein SESBI_39000 [Sesbania bispinosa]|nr:hypothetical protein SESBI_39000 [Sesbania bispinosa]